MVESNFKVNCSNFTLAQLEGLNYTRSISAMVSAVVTLLVLLGLICNKAYKTTLQRLFFYLTIVVLLQLVFISMDIQLQFQFSHQDELCHWIAFLIIWMAIATYFFAIGITIHVLHLVYSQLRKNDSNIQPQRLSRLKITLEIALVLVCILTPLTFLWVPFYHGTYGVALKSCWIINMNKECKILGFKDQISFSFGIFEAASFIIVAAFAAIAILFCVFAFRYKLTRRHHLRTISQTLLLMTFLTISAFLELIGLMQFLYNTLSGNSLPYGVQVTYEGVVPISQMIIPLGFITYFYSLKKFKCVNFKCKGQRWRKVCLCCLGNRRATSPYILPTNTNGPATAPESTRQEPPSESYFDVPYTGEFTSITDPLISKGDTGYGSIADTKEHLLQQ